MGHTPSPKHLVGYTFLNQCTLSPVMRMLIPHLRLLIESMMLTLGVVLILWSVSWLEFVGLGLISLSLWFSFQQRIGGKYLVTVVICNAFGFVFLMWGLLDGSAVAGKARPLWFCIVITAFWLWRITSEVYRWRNHQCLTIKH